VLSRVTVDIEPFRIQVAEAVLEDLRDRLARTRWPERETVEDWSQGMPLAYARELCEYWRTGYDWRRIEAQLNAIPQFRVEIDGLNIHFLHVRSPHRGALPLVLTHGWPGSVVEFMKVISPLVDPARHGGDPADAFDVVFPVAARLWLQRQADPARLGDPSDRRSVGATHGQARVFPLWRSRR
jgi:hypothetical protein